MPKSPYPELHQFTYEDVYTDWIDAFNKTCFNSEMYGWGLLHMAVGQLPNIRNIRIPQFDSESYQDPRIHLVYLADSASGKGRGAEAFTKLCDRLSISVKNTTQFTDAALIGTVGKDEDGDPELTPGLLSGFKETFQPDGSLINEPIHVIYVSEASSVIDDRPREHEKLIMNMLQIAMNPYGTNDNRVGKDLVSGPSFGYYTNVSIFLTTFPPDTLTDIVLKRGLLQRMLLVTKNTTHKERGEVMSKILQHYKATAPIKGATDRGYTSEELMDMVVEQLAIVNEWAADVNEIHFEPEAIDEIDKFVKAIHEKTLQYKPFLQKKLGEFVTRFLDQLIKLCAHVAILGRKRTVQKHHVQTLLHTFAAKHFIGLVTYLGANIDEPASFRKRLNERIVLTRKAILRARRTDAKRYESTPPDYAERNDLIKHLTDLGGITRQASASILSDLEDYGVVLVQRNNTGKTFYKVDPSHIPENEPKSYNTISERLE